MIGSPTSAWRAFIIAGCLCGILLGLADSAEAYRRRRGRGSQAAAQARKRVIAAAETQVAAGKQLLAAAERKGDRAQAEYSSALAKMKQAASEFESAQQEVRDLAKQLAEIETEIVGEQSADSPYALAQLEFEKAKRELQGLEEQFLAAPEVQAKLGGLQGVELFDSKASELERHPEHIAAKARFELAAKEVDRIRRELYRADQDWKDTAEALTDAREERLEAETDTHNVTRLGPLHDFKNAQQAAAYAKSAIARGEATLRRLKPRAVSKSGPNSSAKSKK